MLLETLMCYYQSIAKTTEPVQAFRQVAEKLEPQQQEHIMYIGEALMAQGKQEGRQEGIAKGRQEERYAVASNMLKEGTDPGFIHRVTRLPLEEIQNTL